MTPNTSITNGLILVSLNVRLFDKRLKDKDLEEDIAAQKGAHSTAAASVYKPLFVNSPLFKSFKTLRGQARVWINKHSAPYDDNGWRFVTTERFYELNNDFSTWGKRWNALVEQLKVQYQNEISKQAFERGRLFNRDEYPTLDEIVDKFEIGLSVRPFPQKGHIIHDANNAMQQEIAEIVEKQANAAIEMGMHDTWDKLKTHVERVRERVTAVLEHVPDMSEEVWEEEEQPDGSVKRTLKIRTKRRPKLHETMLDDGLELCEILKGLNVTNDPALEEARASLQKALLRIDMDTLKKNKEMQQATKKAMEEIADKFF